MSIMLSNAERLAMEAAAEAITPPPPVDYLAWAAANIVFTKRESPLPGAYNAELFPYFSEILRALSPDDPCRIVTFAKSAQLGGTVLANIFTLGSLDIDPCDFLYVHPTEDNGRRWSKMKLSPMLKNTASVRALFPSKSRDGGDSVFYKERIDGRGAIQISGANSPSSLSLVSMRRQVQDDLAKWEANQAGDPERQADSRSRAHEFAKVFKVSTPLIVPGCRITRNYLAGSQERFHVPCPECDALQTLDWENMLAGLDEAAPEKAHFTCVECGCEINEHHRPEMIRRGRWIADNQAAAREHRSFYIWSAYSLLQSFERIAREWLAAKGDPASEQVFMNDTVGRAYEAKGEAPAWEELRDRAADPANYMRGSIPAGALLLTLGLDCQKDRVEAQLVGWGRDLRRWVVEYAIVHGHISEAATQAELDKLIAQKWTNESGRRIGIDLTAIDGNAWTEEVWDWVRRHPASKVIMVRGVGSEMAPLFARVKREKGRDGKTKRYSKRFYNFAASVLKMALYRNARKTDPMARGFVGLPRGLEDEYFCQLCAERRVEQRGRDGFVRYRWVKDPVQANEALDTMLQAEAAAIRLAVRTRTDEQWDLLEAERETPPEERQLDLEDVLVAPAKAAAPAPKPSRGALGRLLKDRTE